MKRFKIIYKLLLRLVVHASRWRYGTSGECPSCGYSNYFLYSRDFANQLSKQASAWDLSAVFQRELKRALALTVLGLLGMDDNKALSRQLSADNCFSMYETSCYSVFSSNEIQHSARYVVSEYFPEEKFGVEINGVRNENLENLTFPDNQFDVVITSEVLEHVADLDVAIEEIMRVLKPGGYHVFTVPVDRVLPQSRERVTTDRDEHKYLFPQIFHGDTIRDEGVLVCRDFGSDIMDFVSRGGFECRRRLFMTPLREETYVYFAQKVA